MTSILIFPLIAAVGQFAIQLARLSGFRVATTASPRNFALVHALGADPAATVDYAAPDAAAQLQRAITAASGRCRYALDTISTEDSLRIVLGALAPGPAQVVVLLKPRPDWPAEDGIEVKRTSLFVSGPGAEE